MLGEHVPDSGHQADPNNHQLARLPVELRVPAHGADVVEPGRGQGRAIEEEVVDVQEAAAAPAFQPPDQVRQLGMIVLHDQWNPCQTSPASETSVSAMTSASPCAA